MEGKGEPLVTPPHPLGRGNRRLLSTTFTTQQGPRSAGPWATDWAVCRTTHLWDVDEQTSAGDVGDTDEALLNDPLSLNNTGHRRPGSQEGVAVALCWNVV